MAAALPTAIGAQTVNQAGQAPPPGYISFIESHCGTGTAKSVRDLLSTAATDDENGDRTNVIAHTQGVIRLAGGCERRLPANCTDACDEARTNLQGAILFGQYLLVSVLENNDPLFNQTLAGEMNGVDELCKKDSLIKSGLGYNLARAAVKAVLKSAAELHSTGGAWPFSTAPLSDLNACMKRLQLELDL